MGKRILVTGGTGYIGSQLVQSLSQLSLNEPGTIDKIVCIDIREAEKKLSNVEYHTIDVRDEKIESLFVDSSFDTVIHLACILVAPKNAPENLQYEVDVLGTERILELCVKHKVKRIINTSSGAAYGYHADNAKLLEEDHPLRGNDEFIYCKNKKLVEDMLANYRSQYPELLQFIFRLTAVLGAGIKNHPVGDLFKKKFLFTVSGAENPYGFIWDQDVISALTQAIFSDKPGCYNLAGDNAVPLEELSKIVDKRILIVPVNLMKVGLTIFHKLGLTQYSADQIKFIQYRPVLSNDKIKNEFGFTPKKSAREVFETFYFS